MRLRSWRVRWMEKMHYSGKFTKIQSHFSVQSNCSTLRESNIEGHLYIHHLHGQFLMHRDQVHRLSSHTFNHLSLLHKTGELLWVDTHWPTEQQKGPLISKIYAWLISQQQFPFIKTASYFLWLTTRIIKCSEQQDLIKFIQCRGTIHNLLYILAIMFCIFSK